VYHRRGENTAGDVVVAVAVAVTIPRCRKQNTRKHQRGASLWRTGASKGRHEARTKTATTMDADSHVGPAQRRGGGAGTAQRSRRPTGGTSTARVPSSVMDTNGWAAWTAGAIASMTAGGRVCVSTNSCSVSQKRVVAARQTRRTSATWLATKPGKMWCWMRAAGRSGRASDLFTRSRTQKESNP